MEQAAGGVGKCPLCEDSGGELIWQTPLLRIVLVDEQGYPGFCRVILNQHIVEMTDLSLDDRHRLMSVVYVVESVLRRELTPAKVNLASLGNVVPHLHWHVIPRWRDDPHFPQPIWGEVQREAPARQFDANRLKAALASAMLMQEQVG